MFQCAKLIGTSIRMMDGMGWDRQFTSYCILYIIYVITYDSDHICILYIYKYSFVNNHYIIIKYCIIRKNNIITEYNIIQHMTYT